MAAGIFLYAIDFQLGAAAVLALALFYGAIFLPERIRARRGADEIRLDDERLIVTASGAETFNAAWTQISVADIKSVGTGTGDGGLYALVLTAPGTSGADEQVYDVPRPILGRRQVQGTLIQKLIEHESLVLAATVSSQVGDIR